MKKNILAKIILIGLFVITHSWAEASCTELYKELIVEKKSQQIKNTAQSATLALLTILFPPAGAMKLGSIALKSKLSIDGLNSYISLRELQKIDALLSQAEVHEGDELEAVYQIVTVEQPNATIDDVANLLNESNEIAGYCVQNVVSNYKDILMSLGVSEELAQKSTQIFNVTQKTDLEAATGTNHLIPGH